MFEQLLFWLNIWSLVICAGLTAGAVMAWLINCKFSLNSLSGAEQEKEREEGEKEKKTKWEKS